MFADKTVTVRLSWRLKELPAATGLSLPFWRKVVQNNRIKARKVEGAIVILDADLRAFLEGREEGNKCEADDANQAASHLP